MHDIARLLWSLWDSIQITGYRYCYCLRALMIIITTLDQGFHAFKHFYVLLMVASAG
jgi:hypothetical protein